MLTYMANLYMTLVPLAPISPASAESLALSCMKWHTHVSISREGLQKYMSQSQVAHTSRTRRAVDVEPNHTYLSTSQYNREASETLAS